MKSIISIKKAAKNWEEGLPIGNGRIGASVLGKISEEMITINEESIWFGPFRNRKNPDCISMVPEIRELLLKGEVAKGNQIGRTIGFRTANLEYPPELINLPFGVYSTEVSLSDTPTKSKAIANFGTRPTVNGKKAVLEVHILDFDKDIYGETINVEFNKMIRTERKFSSLDALKNQIILDIKSI